MACGADQYGIAIAGTVVFGVGVALLHYTGYGAKRQPDGLLRFAAPPGLATEEAIAKTLQEYCRTFSLVTLREAAQGTMMEHAYQISVHGPDLRAPLVSSLKAIPGVQDVALLLQEPTLDL
jgi:hypothetical protein